MILSSFLRVSLLTSIVMDQSSAVDETIILRPRDLQEFTPSPTCTPPPPDGPWNTYRHGTSCRSSNDCNMCEQCNNDNDCIDGLECYFREDSSALVPGCSGTPSGTRSYCYSPCGGYVEPVSDAPSPVPTPPIPTVSPTPQPTGTPSVSYEPTVSADPTTFFRPEEDYNGEVIYLDECPPEGCGVCTGDCKSDADCAENLLCWRDKEDRGYNSRVPVPGCNEGIWDSDHRWGHIGSSSFGYCFDPWNNQTFPEQEPKSFTEWQAEEFYFNHENDAPCCQVHTAYPTNINVTIPISGMTNISDGSPTYMNTTYIYVIDVSGSTSVSPSGANQCGDQTGEGWVGDILDCEVLSFEYANDDAIASGQVDLVGLVNFSTTGAIMSELIAPWQKSTLQHRDEDIIEALREVYPDAFTNFSAGVELACDLAERPENDNQNTVVIFLSDGLPNRGYSSQTRIQTSCNNAIFRTYAVTEDASCYKVDPATENDNGSNPDTLAEIAAYSGGTCEYVPVVSDLPEILKKISDTKVLSVHVEVNGTVWDAVDLTFTVDPPFTGPNGTEYNGTIDLPVGVHEVCFVSTNEIVGNLDRNEVCQQIVVLGVEMPELQISTTSGSTSLDFTTTLIAPGGTIESCCAATAYPMSCTVSGGGPNDGLTATMLLDPDIPFTFQLESDGTQFGSDFVQCCADMPMGQVCGQSEVFWQDSPSTAPTQLPSDTPSFHPTPSPTQSPTSSPTVATDSPTGTPTKSPTSQPTMAPTNSPTGMPTMSPTSQPTTSPTNSPTPPDATSAPTTTPTAPPPTSQPTTSPTSSPTTTPTGSPTSLPTTSPTNSPTPPDATSAPTGTPTNSPTSQPTMSPTNAPTRMPTASPTSQPAAATTTSPAVPILPDATSAPSATLTASPTSSPTAAPTAPPTSHPTTSPTTSPTPPDATIAPTDTPTASPVAEPTSIPVNPIVSSLDVFPMSCNYGVLPPNGCSSDPQPACRPLRYPAYCPPEESFLDLISTRHDAYTTDPASVTADGYWYHLLENKLATKMFLSEAGFDVPELYFCSTDMNNGLVDFAPPVSNSFVVKVMGMHSDVGIYVLPNGFGGVELLTGQTMTMIDVQNALAASGGTEFIVEEYVGDPVALGDEFKFHMFNGTVGSIVYSTNRGTECECFAELDSEWNRIDTNGCVRPGDHTEFQSGNTCPVLDTARGLTVQMKGLDLCSNAPPPDGDLLDRLTTTAQSVSESVGVYIRVDMIVDASGNVVVGELTPNHTNGRVHCAVMWNTFDACLDPCALGNLWAENSGSSTLHGGDATPVPTSFTTVGTEFTDMCTAMIAP